MSPAEEDIGVEALDASIEKLDHKKTTLRKLKHILEEAPEDIDLYVEDARDSAKIHVIIKADEIVDVMEKLAWMDFTLQGEKSRPSIIEYNLKEEQYILDKKFRTDR